MTFRTAIDEIRNVITSGLQILGVNELKFDITQTPRAEFGDVTTSIGFLIAKKTVKNHSR